MRQLKGRNFDGSNLIWWMTKSLTLNESENSNQPNLELAKFATLKLKQYTCCPGYLNGLNEVFQ